MNNKSNTEAMVSAKKEQARAIKQRVLDVINQMAAEGLNVNFNSVSVQAKVSKTYLYQNTELSNKISVIRDEIQRGQRVADDPTKNRRSDASKDILLLAKEKKIKDLESEVSRLNKEIKTLQATIFEGL